MEQGFQGLFQNLHLPGSMVWGILAVSAIAAYLLGCLNGAVIVSKYILQDDVRDHGSGNAGLTNFHRTFGGKLTLAVIAADVLKMLLAVFMASALFSVVLQETPIFVRYWAGVWCALGHMFPCMFRFRGGKGILSGGALAILLDWRVALAVWGIFILIAVATRLVSLASCAAGALFPVMTMIVYRDTSIFIMSLIVGGLILWQHRGNLSRLVQGKESKFSLSGGKSKGKPPASRSGKPRPPAPRRETAAEEKRERPRSEKPRSEKPRNVAGDFARRSSSAARPPSSRDESETSIGRDRERKSRRSVDGHTQDRKREKLWDDFDIIGLEDDTSNKRRK